MLDSTQLKRFMDLFRGNSRSFGQFDPDEPKNRSMKTLKEPLNSSFFEKHLKGEIGLGIVPIRDDGLVWFGAIDIDNHDSSCDLDLASIELKIRTLGLPLILCRSKSGGAHLYLFGREPLRADMAKGVLLRWMSDLNIEGSDCVFPKQTKLIMDAEGNRALGNWINLPYFNAHETNRYAIENGCPCSFDLFLTNAETNSITQEELEKYFNAEHSNAPPCIKAALKHGIENGQRNEALFHITIYNKKRNPNSALEMTHSMQAELFEESLPYAEANRTIKSALKKAYEYSCKKDPWRDWCDKDECRKLKYGISDSEYESITASDKLPMFTDLIKYINSEPVVWEFKMDGVPIIMTTEELMDYRQVRVKAIEKINKVLPSKLKQSQWTDEILSELMKEIKFEEAPIESTPNGVLKFRLEEFLRKADLTNDGADINDRSVMLRGMPVVSWYQNEKMVMFRAMDYEDYLKRTKTDIPKNKTLWYRANREMGVINFRVRVKGRVMSVWAVPYSSLINDGKEDPINFEAEY